MIYFKQLLPLFLLIVRSIAVPVLLAGISISCIKAPETNFDTSSAPQTVPKSTTSFPIKQDTTLLGKILQQGGLLKQMEDWDGKALFIKVNDNQAYPEFYYYYYKALFIDKNKNNIQDKNDEGFFNPASTLKVGISALVLEKLNQMNLGRETEYRISGRSKWYGIDEDIKRALMISDNESTNRLILFLGFDKLNHRMQVKGLQQFYINRLMLDKGTLVESPAFELRFKSQIIQQVKQSVSSQINCWEIKQRLGNCASASDLAEVMIRLIQPEVYNHQESFDIREEDRLWVQQIMSKTPRQEGFNYADDYCRFLHPLSKKLIHESGRMLSKCGTGLFSNTYIDNSFIETDSGQKYYIIFALNPPQGTARVQVLQWMNKAVQLIITKLP